MPTATDRALAETRHAELIGAALRYAAVADWFESRSIRRLNQADEAKAMAIFGQVEAELRAAGAAMLKAPGHRRLLLEAASAGDLLKEVRV